MKVPLIRLLQYLRLVARMMEVKVPLIRLLRYLRLLSRVQADESEE